jgi:uncharacterized protein
MNSNKILEMLYSYNRFWKTGMIEAGIERDLLPVCISQLDNPEVLVLKGIRRCGKSTLMAQIIWELLKRGENSAAILRINLEEPLLSTETSVELLEQIYRVYREKVNPSGKCWLFLDEIQQIPGWESWVRGRLETEELKIFVTGSSSHLLSGEIGTKLTGRNISFEVFPLSFKEFLRFRDITVTGEFDYVANKPVIRNLFNEYLHYGGFPEVVLRTSIEDKEILLKQYFDDLVYRDIISRYEIRDVGSLRNIAIYLLTQVARQTSITKLKNNFSISQDKTENYVSAIMESYLLFDLRMFSFSMKQSMRAGFKPYAIDTGLRNRVSFSFSEDIGWLVENVVASFLVKQYEDVFFSKEGGETDFVVKEGLKITKRIQVWYDDPSVSDIPERELAGLKAIDQINSESLLVTNDFEGVIDYENGPVRCIPIIKLLLGVA